MSLDPDRFLIKDEPVRFNKELLDEVMAYCADLDTSDITIKTGQCIYINLHGKYYRVTRRPLNPTEVGEAINGIYGANGTSYLRSGKAIDISYSIKRDRENSVRFRVNATSCLSGGSGGIEITMRVIKAVPPDLSTMGIEQEITDNFAPDQGMVLITGETGSGKSTLMASHIRALAENPETHRKILTYEAPIEYVYDEIDSVSTLITQTEVPRDIGSFREGVENAMRRNPSIILIGEARDLPTFEASIEAAKTGHLLLSTMHTNGVPSTMRRMVGGFPSEQRDSSFIDIMENIRLIVNQRLVPSRDGRRVALREYLVFDAQIKNKIYSVPIERAPMMTRQMMVQYGKPLIRSAEERYQDGLIDEAVLERIRRISDTLEREANMELD